MSTVSHVMAQGNHTHIRLITSGGKHRVAWNVMREEDLNLSWKNVRWIDRENLGDVVTQSVLWTDRCAYTPLVRRESERHEIEMHGICSGSSIKIRWGR